MGDATRHHLNQRRKGVGLSLQDRFWIRVDKQPDDGCWLWTGGATKGNYGIFTSARALGDTLAHRLSYRWFVGPIPEGFQVDHQCHNRDRTCRRSNACPHRRCIRPDHLDACLPGKNQRRATGATETHCMRGHPYAASLGGGDIPTCRICEALTAAKEGDIAKKRRRVAREAVTRCPDGHELPHGKPIGNSMCPACALERARPPRKTATRRYQYAAGCKNGHEYNSENTHWTPEGSRSCRACSREKTRKHREKLRAGAAA